MLPGYSEADQWRRRFLAMADNFLQVTDPLVAGYLTTKEGQFLCGLSLHLPPGSVAVELGSFCGKSSRWLATGTLLADSTFFMVDPCTCQFQEESPLAGHELELFFGQNTSGVILWNLFSLLGAQTDRHYQLLQTTSRQAALDWEGEGVDLLFVDGNHEECQQDMDVWLPYLQPWAMVVLHDVTPTKPHGVNGPINTMTRMVREGGWKIYGQENLAFALTRDPEWWLTRRESTHDRYFAGRTPNAEPDHAALDVRQAGGDPGPGDGRVVDDPGQGGQE